MGHNLSRALRGAILPLLLIAPAAGAAEYEVEVGRSAYGIPHITAKDFKSLAYGYGHEIAKDNICVLAEAYVTVSAERSRFFGPDKSYPIRGNGSSANNLNSDFFYKQIIDEGRIEKLMAQPPPVGPQPGILEAARGFVDGYNAYLREIGGPDGVTDPACKGKEWVRPIDEITVHRRWYSLALLASSGVAIDGIATAAPPRGGSDDGRSALEAVEALEPGELDERLSGLGSNALALGSDATKSGNGMVYGNPHFPWEGPERFYQAHLTIPGKVNVAGGSLFGVPIVLIGHTNGMAWSHTVSTARRFTPFELRLVPGSPTTYLYDGQPREMTKRKVTVQALTADGKLESRSRTLYSSHHGPILESILGLPVFPWTEERAFALGDANATNYGRLLNHFFEINQAQTVDDVDAILRKYLGIPWVNTIAADTQGNAYYADIGSIPNVPDAKLQRCRTAVGVALDAASRLPVLDGSTSGCEWDTDPDAIAPGIFGPKNLPSMRRADYTSNMNDSYWLTNPRQPLEGYARIIGEERTARSLRTRNGIVMVEEILGSGKFDIDNLRSMAMSNRVHAAELWLPELVAMCRQFPFVPSSSGPVSTAGACEALEAFDARDDLDSRGAVLFRRFAIRALSGVAQGQPSPYRVGFDPSDPVHTPRGLNTEQPHVRQALGDAINELRNNGIPLDSPLRGIQYERRGGEPIPVHGGPHATGVFNVITALWGDRTDDGKPNADYGDINHGSSFVQAVELTPGCPKARTILTYSQSTDPTNPHYADQNRLYAGKGWVSPPFCAGEMKRLRSAPLPSARAPMLRDVEVVPGRRLLRVRFHLQRRAHVTVVARRGKQVVRRVSRKRLRAGRHAVRLKVPRGRISLTISARAGSRRETVRLASRRAR